MEEKLWHLYILECKDKKLYTGISSDVPKRVETHNAGKGCKFTRCRVPVRLLYVELCGTRADATRRELEVKKFTRQQKFKLIENEAKLGPIV